MFNKGNIEMKFEIDNKILNLEEADKDNFYINSHPEKYSISLTDKQPLDSIENIYADGDVVLVDKKLISLYGLNTSLKNMLLYPVEATEENKTIETCLELVKFLSERGFNKGNALHVVGGGIIQDIGSFTGAIYKRGINWTLFPSTLLSMCDSCIGGKNGINFNGIKNQLALFSSPKQVIICTKFINTLKEKEIKSGLGEALKLLSMGGEKLIKEYNSMVKKGQIMDNSSYPHLIKRSLFVKKQVVEKDEFELNIRKALNYGHTIGHALETMSNYEITHGESVAIGMLLINKMYSRDLELLNTLCSDLIDVKKLKLVDLSGLKGLILKDKKTVGTEITFIVLEKSGKTVFIREEVNDLLVERIISEINTLI